MDVDPGLADAVSAFYTDLVAIGEDICRRRGVSADSVPQAVAGEAFVLAGAFADCDEVLTEEEGWTLLRLFAEVFAAFGEDMGSTPAEMAPKLRGMSDWLSIETTELRKDLQAADREYGTSYLRTYHDRAVAIGIAVAAIDARTSELELRGIERFRAHMATLGTDVPAAVDVPGLPTPPAAPTPAAPGAPAADAPRPLEELMAELDGLIGLEGVKAEVRLVTNLLQVQAVRKQRGLPVVEQSRHLVFTGNPGTGKTTVARLLAQIYRTLGVVQRGHLVETDRSGLVAGYVGQTAPKVVEVVDSADEGVLLIDEAYALVRGGGEGGDFGMEAVDTLIKLIEDRRDRLVVVMAGYPDEMADLLASNPGMASRFPKTIAFEDYSSEDLMAIFRSMGKANGYVLSPAAEATVRHWFDSQPRDKGFGNGRTARNLFEAAVANHATRLVSSPDATDAQLTTLEPADIPPPPPPS